MRLARALAIPIVLSLGVGAAHGQDSPVPPIPGTLPLAARNSLGVSRKQLQDRLEAYNRKVDDFTARCGRVPATAAAQIAACQSEYQAMTAEAAGLGAEKKRFAGQLDSSVVADQACATIAVQLERDKDALKRQQKTNEMGVAEIAAWTKANEEALRQGALDGVKAAAGVAASALEKREKVARAFEGSLTKYAQRMKSEHLPFEALQGKIETAMRGYANAKLDVAAGKLLTGAGTAADVFANFQTEAGLVAKETAESDAAMKAALNDPAFRKFVEADATEWDLLRSTLDVLSSASGLAKFSPQYATASLLVDGAYDSKKWSESKARIMQQYDLSDTELRAVAALQGQIQRTMGRLKACRAE